MKNGRKLVEDGEVERFCGSERRGSYLLMLGSTQGEGGIEMPHDRTRNRQHMLGHRRLEVTVGLVRGPFECKSSTAPAHAGTWTYSVGRSSCVRGDGNLLNKHW